MALNLSIITVTAAAYTISVNYDVILVNRPSGPVTITLPVGSAGEEERSYYIKDISGTSTTNPITIKPSGGRLLDGETFGIINGRYSHVHVLSDGTNWYTIA